MKHTHKTVRSSTQGFVGCNAGMSCNPTAHGGVTFIYYCQCGAVKKEHSNGRFRCKEKWEEVLPK